MEGVGQTAAGEAGVTLAGVVAPVWGFDVSTRRISMGVLSADGSVAARTLSIEQGDPHKRLAYALREVIPWLRVPEAPALVGVEQPFGASMNRVDPQSFYMVGIVLAAVGVVAPAATEVLMLPPQSWKSRSVGHGRAKKHEIMAWAREQHGYTGSLEDEADAIGVTIAAPVKLLELRS